MTLNPLTWLEKAINEHGSSTILGQNLALIKDMLAKVEKEKSELEKSLSEARKELIELKKKIPAPHFVEYRGAKFKRKPSGGYENAVYCPICEIGMGTIPNRRMPFTCGRCKAFTSFFAHELHSILKEVEIEYP